MRLIDAEALKKALIEASVNMELTFDIATFNCVMTTIDNTPTVDKTNVISYIDGLIDGAEAVRPQGKWIYPYYDTIIGKKRVGKSIKQCSVCDAYFCNNIPWDAKFCPLCGSYNEESNTNGVDNI